MEKEQYEKARTTARNLFHDVTNEIGWLEKCPDCYTMLNFDVLEVCSKPHLVVWAQFDMYVVNY